MIGQFMVPVTRGDAGRKIDSWEFHFPDGEKAVIEISLRTDKDASTFIARSNHPMLRGAQWIHSDIQVLRKRIEQDIQDAVQDFTGEKWAPGLEIELSEYRAARHQDNAFHIQIVFQAKDVMFDTQTPPSNRGERRVLRDGKPGSSIERKFTDPLGDPPSGPLTPETMRELRFREDTPTGRSIAPESDRVVQSCRDIQETLSAFAAHLGDAIGPGKTDPEKLPTPDDLARFMARAAQDIKDKT